jgi:hypothetical protein
LEEGLASDEDGLAAEALPPCPEEKDWTCLGGLVDIPLFVKPPWIGVELSTFVLSLT